MLRPASLFFLLLVIPATCPSQVFGPAVGNAGQTAKVVTVSGRVLDSVTGNPVRRALVQGDGAAAMTDDEGRFELLDVPFPVTRLIATKPGYFNQEELGHYADSSIIAGPLNSVVLKLTPAAIVTGVVTSIKGEPVEGVMIQGIYARVIQGRKRWERRAGAQTEEDGSFRLPDLLPGTYYIAAASFQSVIRFPLTRGDRLTGWAPAYFPNSPDRASATPIRLAAGEHMRADFELQEAPLFRVRGRVSGVPPGGNASVTIRDNSGSVLGAARFNSETGAFQFDSLPAGLFHIQAGGSLEGNSQTFYGETTINLQGDLDNVQLAVQPLPPIPIELHEIRAAQKTETSDAVAFVSRLGTPFFLQLSLHSRSNDADYTAQMEKTSAGVRWVLRDVPPGKYSVQARASGQWYVDSVSCGSADLMREDLIVPPGSADPIEVTVRNDMATLSVEIPSSQQAATLLVIPDSAPGNAQAIQNMQGGVWQQFAPGGYNLLALPSVDDLEYTNPEVMRPYLSKATHVTLSPNQQTKVRLELVADAP